MVLGFLLGLMDNLILALLSVRRLVYSDVYIGESGGATTGEDTVTTMPVRMLASPNICLRVIPNTGPA